MNPLTLISWSSKLLTPPFLLAWRICAHRTTERELIELRVSLPTDVAKVRRHICIAGGVGWMIGEFGGARKLIGVGVGPISISPCLTGPVLVFGFSNTKQI